MGANKGTLEDVNENLLREIVEIAAEVSPDRILRKTYAAARRLIPHIEADLCLFSNSELRINNLKQYQNSDLQTIEILTTVANMSLNNIQGNGLAQSFQINEERLRIARDLHDRVLQRIFSVGLSLEGALRKAVINDVIVILRQAIVDLDGTVGEIRTTVSSLKGPISSIRQRILQEIELVRNNWKVSIDFSMRGPLDTVLPVEYFVDVLAVASELLSNAARHGKNLPIKFELVATGSYLEIKVTNFGGEVEEHFRFGHGLINLSERAALYSGELLVENLRPGMKVSWKIPL